MRILRGGAAFIFCEKLISLRFDYEYMNRGKGQISYSRSWVIMLQDSIVSVLSSLLAIMFARWISEPVPGFSGMVFKWLAVSFAGTFAGMLLFRTHKVVRRHASVRSTARILGAMAVKAVFMSAALLTGFVTLSNVPCCILAVLSDIVMATAGILFTRVSARLMDDTGKTVFAKAASKNALVVWAGDSSVHMAGRLEKEGYNVAGFLSTDPSLSGRVIADKVVFYCSGEKDLDLLQWKLGGLDCIFFPSDMCNSDIGGVQLPINQMVMLRIATVCPSLAMWSRGRSTSRFQACC